MSIIICEKCFHELARKNRKLAILWHRLADLAAEHGIYFQMMSASLEEIKELENLGYVLTHETDEMVVLRLEGYQFDEEEYFPCLCINALHDG